MGETEMNIYFCLLYNETKSMPNQLIYTEFVRFLTKDIFLNFTEKIGQIPLASVWLTHSKLFLCTGRTKHTLDRSFYLQPLSFAVTYSWGTCHNQAVAPHQHYRQARQAVVHPYHSLWSVQSISIGQHGAASLPAVPSYLQWNALPVAADDYPKIRIIIIILTLILS